MKVISLDNINRLYSAIASVSKLYAPIESADKVNYALWTEGAEVNLTQQTVRSAKDLMFPQTMDLYSLKMQGKNIEVRDDREEVGQFVIFGVRACDCRSFEVLDKVFLSEPVDTYYKERREAATIIGLACSRPWESCFCTLFSIDPTRPDADVVVYIEGDKLYWLSVTDKGHKLTDSISSVFEGEAAEEQVEAQRQRTREIMDKMPLTHMDLSRFNGDNLNEIFDDKRWEGLSEACLACGTCTYVCPTCQCYDIRDFKTADGVKRFRCWDSCMYSDFTKMSAGQPRTTQMQRFRQRFMHKLVYFPANNDGMYSCVGCGRCVTKCPISMNIAKVITKLGGKDNDK